MRYLLTDVHGRTIDLNNIPTVATLLGRGGSGVVYAHPDLPDRAIKLYHTSPKDYAAQHYRKVMAMLERPPASVVTKNGTVQLAWPSELIRDAGGTFRGFAMHRIDLQDANPLNRVAQPVLRERYGIAHAMQLRLFAALNLAVVLENVHKAGHFVIDLKPHNIVLYNESRKESHGFVALLDCDGFAIRGSDGLLHPAGLATPDYLFPRVTWSGGRGPEEYGQQQDHYAFAVILFQLLNGNIHPLQGVDDDFGRTNHPAAVAERIGFRPSLYAYGASMHPHVQPVEQSLHHWFAPELCDLFERAFSDTLDPPHASEWMHVLGRLSDNTHACLSDYNHWKLGPQCGECAVEARAGIPPGANPTSRQQVVLPSAPISKPKQSRVPTPIIGSILGVLRPGSQNTGPLPHRPIKASPNRNLKQKHRPKAPLWAWFAVTPIAMGLSGLTVSVDTKWVKLLMIGAFLPIGIISFGWMLRSIARYASASGAAGRQHTQTFVKAVLFSSWVVVHIGAGLGTGMATSPLTDLSRAVSIWSWETPFEQQPNDDTISAHRSTSIDSHVRNAIDWVLPAAVRTPHRGIYWSSSGMSGSVTSRGPSADSPGCHFVEVYISSSVNPSSVNPVGAYACPDSRGRYTLRM